MLNLLRRRGANGHASPDHSLQADRNLFRRRYWTIVALEVALLVAGRVVIVAVRAPEQTFVAWIALVVGVHFLAFSAFKVWDAGVRVPGMILATLGLLGLLLSTTSESQWVPSISGVLSGVTLLAGTLTWVARDLGQPAPGTLTGADQDHL